MISMKLFSERSDEVLFEQKLDEFLCHSIRRNFPIHLLERCHLNRKRNVVIASVIVQLSSTERINEIFVCANLVEPADRECLENQSIEEAKRAERL